MRLRPQKPYCEENDEWLLEYEQVTYLASRYKDSRNGRGISIFIVDSQGWRDITPLVNKEVRKQAKNTLDEIEQERK